MREKLSALITEYAVKNPKVLVLSGDHGYALFDSVRRERPDQFINVGVAEQGMIGVAAGLARTGFLPIVYGLSAFLPIRVLEQIKLDLCISKLPVLLLGDGAGLVYSTLGSSHQCGEDIAALRPMPGITIYSPADAAELEVTFRESMARPSGPTYIRIGKSDRPVVHKTPISEYDFVFTEKNSSANLLIIGTGSMSSTAATLAKELNAEALSFICIKPFPKRLLPLLQKYEKIFVLEEHHRAGGLYSSLAENWLAESGQMPPGGKRPQFRSISLRDQFAIHCGGHDYALSEHGMETSQIRAFIQSEIRPEDPK